MDKFRIFESNQHKYLNENSSLPDRKKTLPKSYNGSDHTETTTEIKWDDVYSRLYCRIDNSKEFLRNLLE